MKDTSAFARAGLYIVVSAIAVLCVAWVRRMARRDAWRYRGAERDVVKDVMDGMHAHLGRFFVQRRDGELHLRATRLRVRQGPLIKITIASLWAALMAREVASRDFGAYLVFAVVWSCGLLALAVQAWRVWSPYRRVRASVTVFDALPDPGGLREAARLPKLVVDGRPLPLGDAPRVVLARANGAFLVSIVTPAERIGLDVVERDVALDLAALLCAAMGLPAAREDAQPRCSR